MHQIKFSLIMAAALALTGCGGDGDSAGIPRTKYATQISFGDSLSDVGSYAVGTIASVGGGRYTINTTVDGKAVPANWTERVAAALQLPAMPCAAETGLNGDPNYGFSVPIVFHPECTGYAQGGAMVTFAYGPGNANGPVEGSTTLGLLTVPIVTQIQNHLDLHGGSFAGTEDELVFLLGGGNDAIVNTLIYIGRVQAAALTGIEGAAEAEAAIAGPAAIQAMQDVGIQLAGYVNTMILAKGAKRVAMLYLPDLSSTPFGNQVEHALPGTQALMNAMVQAFNGQLKAGLTSDNVLLVDLYTSSVDQIAHPANYGLTNVTDTACNLTTPSPNILGSSLVCNTTNVIPGDVSHYEFADTVHPTPYAYQLIALYVLEQMSAKNWL